MEVNEEATLSKSTLRIHCLLINESLIFDATHLLLQFNGNIWGYWYTDGYIRTAWKEFSLKNIANNYIHLTNDAIQKYSKSYEKYEDEN